MAQEDTSNVPYELPSRVGMEVSDAIYSGIDQDALDLSFAYEGVNPRDVPASEMQTRIRAATIASSISRTEKDASEVYTQEYQRLIGMLPEDQRSYTATRVSEESSRKYQKDMERFITQGQNSLTVMASPSSSVTSHDTLFSPDYSQGFATFADEYAARAAAIREQGQRQLAAGNYSAEAAMLSGGGKNTYEDLRLRRVIRDRAMLETMEALGYNSGDIVPWKAESLWQGIKAAGWWALETVTGKYVYETFKYDTGALDMGNIRRMDFDKYVASVETLKQKLIDNKASPITVLSTFSAYDPETSRALTGTFFALDFIPLLGTLKYGPKAVRAVQKARVVRSMTTSAGNAAQVGALDVAGKLSAKALLTRDIAKTGTDAITAGMNASPFPFSPLDAAVTDGISGTTLKYVERERMLQNFYINNALGNFETVGALRKGDLEAVEAATIAKLPQGAEVIGRAPYAMQVRVTTANPNKFATPEALATAQTRYDFWHEEYTKAADEMSRFEDEVKSGHWDPDPEWINRLDRNKAKAKAEMDAAHDLLVKGTTPDTVETSTIWYTKDQYSGQITGVLEGNPLWNKTLSAEGYLKTIDELLVPERTLVLAQQEKLLMAAQKMLRSAAYGLSKKQVNNVDAVLTYGSDTKQTFTMAQLMQGVDVPGIGTVRVTKKEELAYYYKYRDTMDATHGLRSFQKYKELGWKGFTKQVFINVARQSDLDPQAERLDQLKVFVKDFKHGTDKDGNVVLRLPDASKILDTTGPGARAEVISIRGSAGDLLKDRIAKGKAHIVEVEKPIRIGDEGYNYMVVSPKRLRDLSPDVLGYRKGYVPNIYRAPFAVRTTRPITFDGSKTLDVQETVRFFDSENEAKVWAAAQTDGRKYIVNSDSAWRETDPLYAAEVDDAVFTGLFEDYRGQKIPFGSEGKNTPVEGAIVAMDRYLENLGWAYPLNDWREGVLARYFGAVNEFLETPNSLTSTYKAGAVNQKQAAAIDGFRTWLMDQLSVTSPAERNFARWAKYTGENMENSFFWKVVRKLPYGEEGYEAARMKFLYGMDKANAYGTLRSLAFHTYLGFFNFSQLFVQAANIGVVMSLHPLNAPSVIRRILALRSVAFVSPMDPQYEKIVRIAAKAALMKYDEFEPMIRAWHKSGWAYTTRSSADTRMASRMLSPGGALRQDARALQKASLIFFTEGELWSRMYGWLDAYTALSKHYRKLGQTVDMTDMHQVTRTLQEATRVSFNYTAANAAQWQKGALSIPTQFLQVPAKFYQELLMPIVSLGKYKSNFSAMERVQMLLGQAIIFGAVGVPTYQLWKDGLWSMLTEKDENGKALFPEVSDEELTWYVGGMTDLLSKQLLDLTAEHILNLEKQNVRPALAQRMSLANGFDLLISNFTAQDLTTSNGLYTALGKSLAGAAGGVLVQQGLPVLSLVLGAHDAQGGQETLTWDNRLQHLSRIAELTKTWDNIQTARLWAASEAILTQKGDVLLPIDPDGEDKAIITLKMMGIDSYERLAALRMNDWVKKNNPEKEIARALKAAEQLVLEYTRDDKLRMPEELENFRREILLLKSSLKSEEDKQKFANEYGKMLSEGKSLASKSYLQMLDRALEYDKGVLGPVPVEGSLIEQRLQKEALKGQM